ncbi:unnamed protein product, partial [Musa hybrid cultivar]
GEHRKRLASETEGIMVISQYHESRQQLLARVVGFDHVYPFVDTRRLFNASSPPDSSEQRGVLPSSPLLSSPS